MKYVFRKKYYAWLMAVVDAAGRIFFRRSQRAVPEPKAILVVRLDHLGDVLSATGIPQALKGHNPTAKIIFLTSTAGKALLENNPYVDEVLVYDAPWFRRPPAGRAGPGGAYEKTGFWKIAGELKKRRIDLGLSLRGDARENFLLFLAGVRFRVGYGITGLGFLMHRELSYRAEAPEMQHSLDVLRALGVHREILLPALFFSEEEETHIKRLAAEGAGKTTVGVQLDAGSQAKTWPEANRIAFLDKLFKRFPDVRFLFFGADPVLASWLEKRLYGTSGINLIGKTTARELLVRLKGCHYFIGPDSGPAHLAASLDVPTLFLYSGTNLFEKWRSLAENADFLRNPVPCSPCHLTECNVQGHPCMSGISSEEVLEWLKERFRAA